MSERQKATKFLKSLIQCDDSEHCHELRERIKRAERDEKCIRTALFLVIVLGLLSVSGIGYAAVLVPEFGRFSSHIATKIFCALGLACGICMGVFVGVWLHHRAVTNRIYEECRRFIHGFMESRLKPPHSQTATLTLETGTTRVYKIQTPKSQDDTGFLQRAS